MFLDTRFWDIIDANYTATEQDLWHAATNGMAPPNTPQSDPPTLETRRPGETWD